MKKLFVTSVILSLMVIAGCSEVKTIEQRIEALEDALNDNDYLSFLECFSSDAVYFDSMTDDQFNILTSAGTTSWDFGTIRVNGNSASCAANKTELGSTTPVLEEFDMVEDGGGYVILQWREEGDVMMNVKTK